ncbi:lytic transglycosylase domain-containing protein [Kitasatospora acidiphila]|uniref:lytic transglycosylase domain-containing protein n=1 Tax=Kitasatospora acidiphila TaxID=2567942 RepID=UPI003C76D9B3
MLRAAGAVVTFAAVAAPTAPLAAAPPPPLGAESPVGAVALPPGQALDGGAHRSLPQPPTPAGVAPSPGPVQPVVPVMGGAQLPATVFAAYRKAETSLALSTPDCHLPWQLLAGIGQVESGQADGGRVDANGTTYTPILGPLLDGTGGNAAIPDSDGGKYGESTVWAQAVGPMQFIPSTWATWGADGNGDGVADPNNIWDAALAAGRYLCADGRDLAVPAQLDQAVLGYNHSDDYLRTVKSWMTFFQTGVSTSPDSPALPGPVLLPTGPASPLVPGPAFGASPSPSPSTPTSTPTASPSPFASPTATPKPTPKPTPTAIPSPSGSPTTASPSPSPSTPAPTPTGCPSPTASTSAAPTGAPSPTGTPSPTATPSPTPSPTTTPSPTATPTGTPSPSPSATGPSAPPSGSPAPGCGSPSPSGSPAAPSPSPSHSQVTGSANPVTPTAKESPSLR